MNYLSIIITGRNDNYGGDFISRLQSCITWNTKLLEKYKISTEFIIVNWNPIKEKKSLKEQIEWTENRKYVKYRIITVPPEIHNTFNDPNIRKNVPLYEYLAKNAGIRSAQGEYVLAMNPDILIDEALIKKIAKKTLKKDCYYRANRIDFKNNDIKQQTKIWLKGFTYPANNFYFFTNLKNELRCAWRKNSVQFDRFFKRRKWNVYYHNAEYNYHCNVSGDFMLMHKNQWLALHGNPENTYLALHTDALMVVMAATSGLKEKVFHAPIYHQEHTRRFDATEKGNEENRKAYLYFQKEAQKMIKQQKARIYNDKNWGLANFELPEENF